MSPQAIIWAVAAVATAGVIIRPFDWPEAVWAVTGAALLVVAGLLSPARRSPGSPAAPTNRKSAPSYS